MPKEEQLHQCTRCRLIYRESEILQPHNTKALKKCPNCGCSIFAVQVTRKTLVVVLYNLASNFIRVSLYTGLIITLPMVLVYFLIRYYKKMGRVKKDLTFLPFVLNEMNEIGAKVSPDGGYTELIIYFLFRIDIGEYNLKEDLRFAAHKMGEIGAKIAKDRGWSEAITFYQRALKLLEGDINLDLERWTLERLGTAYMAMKYFDKTQECYEKALDLAKKLGSYKKQGQILYNLKILERKRKAGST